MNARPNWLRALPLMLLALALAAPVTLAQKKKDKDQQPDTQDVMSHPRNKKPEIKKVYRDWVNQDVAYIITDKEREIFNKLQTDEEREQFIEGFWQRRDPDPDTEENEFKEQYYERIAYANEHYASGIPGWKTDRGRIYIMYGKPDEVESHPAGGPYQRESYEGGGETSTYPFERWFYRYIEGVGSGIEIEFVDPTGSGEYRIAMSPEEKDALRYIPGAGLTLREQLGLESKADRVGYNGPGSNSNFGRQQDSAFDWIQRVADLNKPPVIRHPEMANILSTNSVVEDSPLDFDLSVQFFRQADDRVMTAFTIQTENRDLTFKDVGGIQRATMNIFGRIMAVNDRRVGVFEDAVTTDATPEELVMAKERKSAYGKAVPLPPGHYRVDVIVRDINSGAQQVKRLGFTVPKYDPKQLSTSTLVLAAKLQGLGDQLPGMFTIGQYKVIPNLAGVFHRGESVGIYMQVYNAGIDQTTLRPAVDVEYVLSKDGKEVGKMAEDWRGMSDAGQRLTLARLLDSSKLPVGDYEITVRIRDQVSGQSLTPSAKFTIVQ
ncbi:MAG: GWxTD domain-containing protein [Acidobacteria bacterium]|nr:MAG: GWxTD domain-containing protein [Acidobacteriota bacterium]